MVRNLASILRSDAGQGLVEYALIVALVSILAIGALRTLGHAAGNTLSNAAGTPSIASNLP